jgi:hypothetical protein
VNERRARRDQLGWRHWRALVSTCLLSDLTTLSIVDSRTLTLDARCSTFDAAKGYSWIIPWAVLTQPTLVGSDRKRPNHEAASPARLSTSVFMFFFFLFFTSDGDDALMSSPSARRRCTNHSHACPCSHACLCMRSPTCVARPTVGPFFSFFSLYLTDTYATPLHALVLSLSVTTSHQPHTHVHARTPICTSALPARRYVRFSSFFSRR